MKTNCSNWKNRRNKEKINKKVLEGRCHWWLKNKNKRLPKPKLILISKSKELKRIWKTCLLSLKKYSKKMTMMWYLQTHKKLCPLLKSRKPMAILFQLYSKHGLEASKTTQPSTGEWPRTNLLRFVNLSYRKTSMNLHPKIYTWIF